MDDRNAGTAKRDADIKSAGTWSLDLQSWRIGWSPSACAIYDAPRGFSSMCWEVLQSIDSRHRLSCFSAVLSCLATGRAFALEVNLFTIAGRFKRVRISGFLDGSPDGADSSLKGTVIELPPRHSPSVPEQATPQQMAVALEEWELLGLTLVRELEGPLGTAHAFCKVLEEKEGLSMSRAGRSYLNRALKYLQHTQVLMAGVLDFSPLGTGILKRELVDLGVLAAECIDVLHAAEPDRKVEVHIEPGMKAQADRNQLRLVLRNLLSNAWKFTSENPMARISFSMEASSPTVYCVRDNGVGFDMRDAGRLFDPFEPPHTGDHFNGCGLGLTMVRRIVERHGGTVWARSDPGAGSIFCFTLPRGSP